MSRLPELRPDQLDERQKAVYERIASGPRGRVRGPLLAWLHSPSFAEAVHPMGEYLRYHSLLSGRLAELAILVVARHWDNDFEWYVHAPLALKAGIAPAVVEAIAAGSAPSFEAADEAAIWKIATELLQRKKASAETFEAACAVLGHAALVELSGLIGYYSLGAFTLNLFEIEPPEGEGPLLSVPGPPFPLSR